MTICGKALGGSQVNLCPRAVPWVLNLPLGVDWRPLGFSSSKPSATSSARPSAKNPRGLRPLGFLALGLAEDVALGLLSENPSGLQSTPRGRLITLGTTLGHRFTWLPPRLFHRLSQSFSNSWHINGHVCTASSIWNQNETEVSLSKQNWLFFNQSTFVGLKTC